MKKVSSKLLFALCVASFALALVGCSGPSHSTTDAKNYVRDMKIGKCTVSSPSTNEHNEKTWTVTQKSTGIVFEVTDDFMGGGMIGGGHYSLKDNYSTKMIEYYEDKVNEYERISLVNDIVVLEYSNLDELKSGCEDIAELFDFLFEQYDGFSCQVNMLYNGVFKDIIEFYPEVSGNSMAHRTQIVNVIYASDVKEGFDSFYTQAKDAYLTIGLAHGIDSITTEFSNEEIEDFMNGDRYGMDRIVTYVDPEDEKVATVSTSTVTQYYFFYGGLFKYLKEQGLDVSGDPLDFTVETKDGKTCEFSYDFYDKSTDETYYLLDGEKVFDSPKNRFNLDTRDLEELFGIKAVEMDNATIGKKEAAGELKIK
ncbi:hypothetical protein [Butyrivibrio proteoclasticus]|uniref:hypothetical protein n=1 Tax=Butyrivibrio proteoclasticus TaxID=43305 RepID=UPI00047BCDD7|nr:hypothetical protein [Butyrivibrio proteoclasticus]